MPALDKYWLRPSMIVFSDTEPTGTSTNTSWTLGSNFLYLSDDSRDAVQVSYERIETKDRMIDGTMRSYFIADKRTFSTSWNDFPSRKSPSTVSFDRGYGQKFIRDSGTNVGAGQDILNWYNTYKKDFWMLLVYDAPILSGSINIAPTSGWAEKIHVFFQDFNFTVTKRGPYHDLWNIDMTLVEA